MLARLARLAKPFGSILESTLSEVEVEPWMGGGLFVCLFRAEVGAGSFVLAFF